MKRPHGLARVLCAALPLSFALACGGEAPPPPVPPPPVASPPPPVAIADAGAPALVHVQILAFNDFHGNLEPPGGSFGYVTAPRTDPIVARIGEEGGVKSKPGSEAALVPAGGAVYMATLVKKLRAENPNTVVVSAGDLTGASPLLSNIFKDEPTVLVMNEMGLDFEGVGNHDFDRGLPELLRLQHGDGTFPGAKYQYLAANVRDDSSHKPVFPPYAIREFSGAKIAFVGMTLEATPMVSTVSAMKGLTFAPEVETANALVPELEKQGVSAIVVLIHQGGGQGPSGTYDSCEGFAGALTSLLSIADSKDGGPRTLDPAVEVVLSGHNHQAYDCLIDGRIVTSAASYGRLVTKIDLTIDPAARRITEKHARNIAVTRDLPPDPEVARIVARYKERAAPAMERVVGYLKGDILGDRVGGYVSCESPLGDVIADAQLEATRAAGHADIALMNPGGVRTDLVAKAKGKPDFVVTYAEAFEVQPFGNELVTMTLTGAQIHALLDQQFGSERVRILSPSAGLAYSYAYDAATHHGAIDPRSLRLHGRPIEAAKSYRVTVNSFLAMGGDGFAILKEGTQRVTGPSDIDAFTAHLGKASSRKAPLESKFVPRITPDACK